MTSAARELARKVAGAVGVDVQALVALSSPPANLSSVSQTEFQQACDAFRGEMAKAGKTLQSAAAQPPANVSLTITLSENLWEYLWVAQVNGYGAVKTFFVAVPRDRVSAAQRFQPSLVLQKQFILSSPEPILDVALLPAKEGAHEELLVLQLERVGLYTQENGAWELQFDTSQAVDFGLFRLPRDARGRLQPDENGQEHAVLPGIDCSIALAGTALVPSCKQTNVGWLPSLRFPSASTLQPTGSTDENTFTLPATGTQEFDSLAFFAPPPASGASLDFVAAAPDGRALLFDGSSTPVATISGWGSDIAALYSSSRNRWPLLVTGTGDWTTADTLQAFHIVDRKATPASDVLEFDGPITTLWSEGENRALAVSRNLKTGMYEAYFIRANYNQ
ncbi:MAG TPA: hypothetical protein VGR81_08260 [Candidatus Acidoferrales bacterium]|nr:hypothetical protein [Candidatus Acidoferrales bacterium]